MHRFFTKAFAFIIGISLVFNHLGSLADRVAPLEDWRVEHQERVGNLQTQHDKIEAITLGNSHSDALDYSVLGIEGQSMAFAAADLFEIEKYARYMSSRLPNLKTVFIAISYYSFSRDNATVEPFRTRRIKYYSMIPVWSPIQGDVPNFVLGRLESYTHILSMVRSDSWKGVWQGLAEESASVHAIPYDGVTTTSSWGACSHYTAEQLEGHAWDIANRNVSSSIQMTMIHEGLEEDAFYALVRTVEQLQSQRVRVVLFTPTYYQSYTTFFMDRGSHIYEDMQRRMEKLRRTHNIEYFDFSHDPEIAIHPELFYNSDHLGDCGHKVFSAKLLNAMNAKADE